MSDKELLLRDLCSRLPYDTIVNVDNGKYREDMKLLPYHIAAFNNWDIKPYLRPLASMTEEELREFIQICDTVLWLGGKRSTCILSLEQIDWLNARRFDYRGLIKKGLAIEAPEGMYNAKTE